MTATRYWVGKWVY